MQLLLLPMTPHSKTSYGSCLEGDKRCLSVMRAADRLGVGLIRRVAVPGYPIYDRQLTTAEVRGRKSGGRREREAAEGTASKWRRGRRRGRRRRVAVGTHVGGGQLLLLLL